MSLCCVGHMQAWGKVNFGIAGAHSDDEQCGYLFRRVVVSII